MHRAAVQESNTEGQLLCFHNRQQQAVVGEAAAEEEDIALENIGEFVLPFGCSSL